jgi:hypothetical protein
MIPCTRIANLNPALAALILAGCGCLAQQPGQRSFPSPEAASAALVQAASANDEKAMLALFGPDGTALVHSGDAAEDAAARANFVQRYREMHRLVAEPGRTVLTIGAHNWPTPIPLVSRGGAWFFDTDAGRQEILSRRVGRNELATIRVCQELVAAQKEFFTGHLAYAPTIASRPGQQDGLYWPAAEGQPPSPIGPLIAAAATRGREREATPYCGYYYLSLARQGDRATGGARDFQVAGRMTGGFAFVAYPALYRSSGVMTFLVNQDGVVWEKNLGPRTAIRARGILAFNPDSSWRKVDFSAGPAAPPPAPGAPAK